MVLIAVGQLSAGTTDDEIAAVRGRMELLLEEVGGCVGSLPALVGSYRRDEAAFHERVTALERRESNCNEAARGLRSALADSLAAESFFHPTGGLVSLVTAVDAVPTGPSGSPRSFRPSNHRWRAAFDAEPTADALSVRVVLPTRPDVPSGGHHCRMGTVGRQNRC